MIMSSDYISQSHFLLPKFSVMLPSSVMVPLLEPPLLLDRGWEEADDKESTGPVGGLGVGDGDGVRVGDVLLEVEEFPDWGLFFNSIFCKGMRLLVAQFQWHEWSWQEFQRGTRTQTLLEWISGRLMSGCGRLGTEAGGGDRLCVWLGCFSGAWTFTSTSPAALFLWAAIWERTLSALPPGGRKIKQSVLYCTTLQCS